MERLNNLLNTSLYLISFSFIYTTFYFILHNILLLSRSYSCVREDKQKYILKNFIKTLSLIFILYMYTLIMYTLSVAVIHNYTGFAIGCQYIFYYNSFLLVRCDIYATRYGKLVSLCSG